MYSRYNKYIDTAVDGLIFDLEHNLNTSQPLVFLYEPVGLSDLRSVSLYDSRVASVESRGLNISRVSFNAQFQGYISLVDIKNQKPDMDSRVSKLETSLTNAIQQQKNFVTLSQWKEVNTLLDQQNQELKDAIVALQSQIDSLKNDVENL
jgi:hypothetical protein